MLVYGIESSKRLVVLTNTLFECCAGDSEQCHGSSQDFSMNTLDIICPQRKFVEDQKGFILERSNLREWCYSQRGKTGDCDLGVTHQQ